jgi:hypothetical protein
VRVIPPTAETATRGVLTVAPDGRRRLSQGVLVEASIVARLLGLRLLSLEATAVLTPADVTTRLSGQRRTAGRPPGAWPPRRSAVAGRGLADAVRNLDEGAKLLEKAHQRSHPATSRYSRESP